MNFIEFLEFCSRVAERWFEDTEMNELEMSKKVEYFLENLLGQVGVKVTYQEKAIEEFSDSDEDYWGLRLKDIHCLFQVQKQKY